MVIKPSPQTSKSRLRAPSLVPADQFPIQFPSNAPAKGSWPPTLEIRMECQAPGFGPIQPQLLAELVDRISPSFFSPLNKANS